MRSSSNCSRLEIEYRGVRAKFRSLEPGIEEFETSLRLEIGNEGV